MTEQAKKQFREDEIVILRHFNKERQEYVTNVYPKVGGRLRLAHEANPDAINIETEIYKYDGNIAVVIATCKTLTGRFTGIGMSSIERDQKIAPAILELAETRAIARALRFAGHGIEYCSAEEVSHLENGNEVPPDNGNGKQRQPAATGKNGNGSNYNQGVNGNSNRQPDNSNGGNGNGNGRLSPKQYKFIVNLADQRNIAYEDLNQKSLETYGVALEHLSKSDASNMIKELQV